MLRYCPSLLSNIVTLLNVVKEDIIIPHVCDGFEESFFPRLLNVWQHYTFYDFIVNKARGKSGPLFNFDVHDDVRLLADATKEKDESHAGKVVERSYYQRNKHIFPASRWEVSPKCLEKTCKILTCCNLNFRFSIRRRIMESTQLLESLLTFISYNIRLRCI